MKTLMVITAVAAAVLYLVTNVRAGWIGSRIHLHRPSSDAGPAPYPENTIGGLPIGGQGWVAPTALGLGQDGRLWVLLKSETHPTRADATPVLVERRADGFYVYGTAAPTHLVTLREWMVRRSHSRAYRTRDGPG